VDERTPMAKREKWAAQIKDTLTKLHGRGVVWGDAKDSNVLIDHKDNAILIDFEGGTTQGWVDREKARTVEGDNQGLERLMDFIFNDKSELRPLPLDEEEKEDLDFKLKGY
jgi:serine/threonine protein kinase